MWPDQHGSSVWLAEIYECYADIIYSLLLLPAKYITWASQCVEWMGRIDSDAWCIAPSFVDLITLNILDFIFWLFVYCNQQSLYMLNMFHFSSAFIRRITFQVIFHNTHIIWHGIFLLTDAILLILRTWHQFIYTVRVILINVKWPIATWP